MTKQIKATELIHIESTENGIRTIAVKIGDVFTDPTHPGKNKTFEVTGFAPASYKNRVICDMSLFPLEMVASLLNAAVLA